MRYFIVAVMLLCNAICWGEEVRHKDYGYRKPDISIFKGMTPTVIDKILSQPQVEWVRG